MRILVGAFLLLSGGTALAADVNGKHAILGPPAAMSCEDFLKSAGDSAVMREVFAWTMGYVTALNLTLPDTYNLIGRPEDYPKNIFDACTASPATTVANAVMTIVEQGHATRITREP